VSVLVLALVRLLVLLVPGLVRPLKRLRLLVPMRLVPVPMRLPVLASCLPVVPASVSARVPRRPVPQGSTSTSRDGR
jgi:hypothetical protein